jgi:hypothetical protein
MPRRPNRRRTNRTKNSIERRLDDLGDEGREHPDIHTVLLAAVKDAHDSDLTAEQRAALEATRGDE